MDPATTTTQTEKNRKRKAAPKKSITPSKKIFNLKVTSAVITPENPKPIVEYIYKKKKVGKEFITERKIGVLYASVNEAGNVCIGFSVCHNSKDKFDYIRNLIHKPGHGLNMAAERAKRWSIREFYDIGSDICWGEINPVAIPSMIYNPLCSFIERCTRYYKDRQIPKWATSFADDYRKMMLKKG